MTENEAIEIIKRKSSIPMGNETFDEIEEAYDIAIQALEKQIPKKVIESDCNDEDDGTWFRCPTCGAWAGDIYCEKCGQKFDWE